VLKSFCIKTNNKQIIDCLLNKFEKIDLENLYMSKLNFKLYNNFIIHYTGKNLDVFYNVFSNILSSVIIEFYENKLINHIINSNYFYFTDTEKNKIVNIVNNYLYNGELIESMLRKDSIIISCIEYFSNNKSAILDGFVNFRLNNYIKILDYIVDMAVNKFIIDREYSEFIDLLKCYIDSKDYGANSVHLIYQNQESTLLDEFKKVINLNNSILNSKFLSDISFSSNDYTLNALLTLLPKKIYIHLVDGIQDEFINTLKLVFDDRIYLCNDCNICKVYRLNNTHILDKL
jgi:putative sporulation protein YtxC